MRLFQDLGDDMRNTDILEKTFDNEMCKSIIDFAQTLTNVVADTFIVMSRKAACFIKFLERHGLVSFGGELVTDRILDINLEQFANKDVVIIDDVVVSGTTIYSIVKKLKTVNVKSIRVYVLGVNEQYYNPELFEYVDSNGNIKNYLQTPYLPVSDAACMRICSNIVSSFALDISPYDVDFPRHSFITVTRKTFEQLVSYSGWLSYDVCSDLQSENNIRNITLLPTEYICKRFDEKIGIPVSKLGYFKIRLFAKFNPEKQQYILNAVPYFLFNEVTSKDINNIYSEWFEDKITENISEIAKMRLLQYVLAEKLFNIWSDSINSVFVKKFLWELDKTAFMLVFPKNFYSSVLEVINSSKLIKCSLNTLSLEPKFEYRDNQFESKIVMSEDQQDNMAVLQTKLIEPFTSLYFNKEIESRKLVLEYGKKAFDIPEYTDIIERLKHGYSYHMLINLLSQFPDIYDKLTTVSLFIDEAIDAGIIVPIIAKEENAEMGTFYFRAYRHGEDVPFGELQEKLCSILLSNYSKEAGAKILSNLRIEKMLVLFIRIGMNQGVFKPSPQDSIYYNVNVDSYLHGNITTVQDISSKRSYHYLKHRTDARWLSEVLRDKGILCLEDNKIVSIEDTIDISIDKSTSGKVAAIGKTFAKLYMNCDTKTLPFVNDDDLVLLSTCMTPQDILNALAAELAIFCDRWNNINKKIFNLINGDYKKIIETITPEDIYISINSGQAKFFNFLDKKAHQRIREISEQFESNAELSIYGTHWDQFWSDSINWDTNSIDSQLLNNILAEGKYLVVFNLLCRILFLCSSDNDKEREKWFLQSREYLSKLQKDTFTKFRDVSKIVSYANEVLNDTSTQNTQKNRLKIYQIICKYVSYVPTLLSDVELLTDRHGKPCQIVRYTHVIFMDVPENKFALVGNVFESYFASNNIDYQVFPIATPSNIFPEPGMWFFLKGGEVSALNQFLYSCVLRHKDEFALKHIKIFYNLSESLRLKISNSCNTRRQFGRFSSYSLNFTNYKFDVNSPLTIYWIFENSRANRNVLKELNKTSKLCFNVIEMDETSVETTMSSSSYIVKTQFTPKIEKYRKEYEKMKRKCEIFISYSEDSQEHIAKIKKIVERLKSENFTVHFYEQAPLGTDMIDFMRKIETCDIALIIGTPGYKERAYNKNSSGVSFEDRILSDVFMSSQRDKIIPIAFGDFTSSFPTPYNKLKGMSLTGPTDAELDTLVSGLINRFKINSNQK